MAAVRWATRPVVSAVPLLTHNCEPEIGSVAVKNSVPPTAVRAIGLDEPLPGTMSFTSMVPAEVPSLFHNSVPCGLSRR